MTTVAIMQPTYLPWCGLFDMLDQADVFVLLDTVAVSKQSWQTRNRIRARDGQVVWLSVPTNATPGMPLYEVLVDDTKDWRAKHWRTLKSAYGHAPHWNEVTDWIDDVLREDWDTLADTSGALIETVAQCLGIFRRQIYTTSTMGLPARADPIHRLADICAAVGAHEYLSPQGSRVYLEGHDIGVPIRWHEYEHPVYDQGGAGWVSHLSVVDLLAWHGPDSLRIIRSGRRNTCP